MSDNLHLWHQVSETAKEHTKAANRDGQKITSINGTSVVMKATEMFGPVGIGWGYEIVEERFDNAGPILTRVNEGETPSVLGEQIMHTIRLKVWYVLEGQRGETEHYGHTPYVYRSKYGATTDFEAPKKSLTDALKKAFSMLGFNADIFLGEYDDPEYQRNQSVKADIRKAEGRDEALLQHQGEFESWIKAKARDIELCPYPSSAKRLANMVQTSAPKRAEAAQYPEDKYQATMERFNQVVRDRLETLKKEQNDG